MARPAFLDRILGRAAAPTTAIRRFDAAGGGRRASTFGRVGPETLTAAAPVRSRARHSHSNHGFVKNAVDAMVAETVGAGIEATSSRPRRHVAAFDRLHFLRSR